VTVWECALKGKAAKPSAVIADSVKTFLDSSEKVVEIGGSHDF
jgi:hypothetical protein